MLRTLSDSLLSLVYPQPCVVCGHSVENRRDGVACHSCWTQTRIFTGSETLCSKCGAFLHDKPSKTPAYCHACDGQFYDVARAVGVYEKALAATILELKRNPHIPVILREHLGAAVNRFELPSSTAIIPIPLSSKRLLERGFNQAEIVAAFVASQKGFSVEKEVLERTVHTAIHRIAMDKKAREMSVAKSFKLSQPEKVAGKDVLLVDDVFTSGATVSACAKILKKGGAQTVSVLTLGRAVLR